MLTLKAVKEETDKESNSTFIKKKEHVMPVVSNTSSEMQSLADEHLPQIPRRSFMIHSSPSLCREKSEKDEDTLSVDDYYCSIKKASLLKTNGRCMS